MRSRRADLRPRLYDSHGVGRRHRSVPGNEGDDPRQRDRQAPCRPERLGSERQGRLPRRGALSGVVRRRRWDRRLGRDDADTTIVTDNHAAANQSDGGGIAVKSGASLSLHGSVVSRNSASAAPPTGRFAAGGGIFVDSGGSLTIDGSSIDANTSSLANSIPTPYPDQDGATDQENAEPGGVFLSDGSNAAIRNSALDGNHVVVSTPLGQAFGADAALCACGDVPLTIANSRIDGNTLTVKALSSDANGPSGPGAVEVDANANYHQHPRRPEHHDGHGADRRRRADRRGRLLLRRHGNPDDDQHHGHQQQLTRERT